MRPSGPTFWRLGGLTGWQKRTAFADVAVSDAHGLRLAADPAGPLSLLSPDGSLGGLVLPRGMALDHSLTLYLLGPAGAWVKRWDGDAGAFVPLAEVGGDGEQPRRLRDARSLAIAGQWLYIADTGNQRVQVFDLRTLVLIDILTLPDWSPVDVAARRGVAYILDAAQGRVYSHGPHQRLRLELHRPERGAQWSRVLVDRTGKLYLLNATDPNRPVLETSDATAAPIPDAGSVRDLFDAPTVHMDEKGRFRLPASLAPVCDRRLPPLSRDHKGAVATPTPMVRTARGAWLLYVLRRTERRVDAYTDARHLRHSWGACMDWQPADVAACGDVAFVLDEQHRTVYRHRAGSENLQRLDLGDTPSRPWSRIACDPGGLIYLYTPGANKAQVFDCTGAPRGERRYPDVAHLFDADRPPEPAPGSDRWFNRNGEPVHVDLSQPSGTPLYRTSGSWQSAPLDSNAYRCQWHRIELELSEFPPGARLSVSTCAHEHPEDVSNPMKAHFIDGATIVAPLDQSSCRKPRTYDFLVQSGLGQYLTVRLNLEGDGFSTPAVEVAKIHYPRDSYLQYLPATYSADDEGRVFLERFLAIFQTEWDALERTIEQSEKFFDPDAVPEGPFLDYLARQWLALTLEGDWTGAQKRRLLSATPKIYPHRGQLAGLRDLLSVYLANVAGLETAEVRSLGFPVIVEGFREREFLFASAEEASQLGPGAAPLWSAAVKRRMQLGVYSTEGEAELVSVGDPDRDAFTRYAHRFRVYVPAAWVRTSAEEKMIRRALDAEKPAHTQYDFCLVEARFRLDAQSTIGLDTIIGEAPVVGLAPAACDSSAPSLPPHSRLGYDTVLGTAAEAAPGGFGIAGKDTVLA